MPVRVAINGFGRIGRSVFRAGYKNEDVEFVAVNDLGDAGTLAHLLKYDSIRGIMEDEVKAQDNTIIVNGSKIRTYALRDPERLPWKDLDVDVVLESTGKFTCREGGERHLRRGARKVVISAPVRDPDVTFMIGINEQVYDGNRHHIISMASCTTSCLAPIAKILVDEFGIESGFMTTVHGYTNDQYIHDEPHRDLRRARAAAQSIIPTTTTAIAAMGEVLPVLKGKLDGMAFRVPTPNVALIDFVVTLSGETTREEVNNALKMYADGPMEGMLHCSEEPLVSCDFNGNRYSCVVDMEYTKMIGHKMVRVVAWYDNEWGFSNRICELFPFVMGN
jgi:glyceraldehyde 3-phosphate dehydrogenase